MLDAVGNVIGIPTWWMLAYKIFPTILLSAAVPFSPMQNTLNESRSPATTIFLVNLEIPFKNLYFYYTRITGTT